MVFLGRWDCWTMAWSQAWFKCVRQGGEAGTRAGKGFKVEETAIDRSLCIKSQIKSIQLRRPTSTNRPTSLESQLTLPRVLAVDR